MIVISSIKDLARPHQPRLPRGDDARNAPALKSLSRTLPEISFDGNSLGDVIDFLHDVTGQAIDVNWQALDAAGVT